MMACNRAGTGSFHPRRYYDFTAAFEAGLVKGNTRVVVVPVVNVEVFPLATTTGPNVQAHLGASSVANVGWRDYGNRCGLTRLQKIFAKHSIRPTAVVSGEVEAREPGTAALLKEFGWEVGGHGLHNGAEAIANMPEYMEKSLSLLKETFGARPTSWLTPRFETSPWQTPADAAAAGITCYLDFVDDDRPFAIDVGGGSLLTCLPYTMECNDISLIVSKNLSPRDFGDYLFGHVTQLADEAGSGRDALFVVCFGLHTFIAGTPAAAREFDRILGALAADDRVEFMTCDGVMGLVASSVLQE